MKKFLGLALMALVAVIPLRIGAATLSVSSDVTLAGYSNAVTKAADRLIALQNENGSWDWAVTDATGPSGSTYLNVAGVTAQGLLSAYAVTLDARYLAAAQKAADYIISTIDGQTAKSINGHNLVFLISYASASGSSSYAEKASEYFNSIFTAANTRCNVEGGCVDVATLVNSYIELRGAATVPNGIPAWDLAPMAKAAELLGQTDKADEIAAALNTFLSQGTYVSTVDNYDLGLVSGISALESTGGDYSTLVSRLSSADGSFGTEVDGKIQTTAYALMALDEVNDSRAIAAADYLVSHFGYSTINGWKESDGSEYAESTSEAVQALATILPNAQHYSIQSAIDASSAGDTIALAADATTTSAVVINKSLTLNGNGYTLRPNFTKTDNSNNAAIMILHSDVTVQNLTIDGASGVNLHGVNTYQVAGVNLNDLTISNGDKAAVIVNGSTVNANSLHTANNGWGGVNVDRGSGVTSPAIFTITGSNSHEETGPAIWIDDITKTDVTVVADQYTYTDVSGKRIYVLPVAIAPTSGSSVEISETSTAPVTVNVPSDATDVDLDLSAIVTSPTAETTSATTPSSITINSDTADFTIPSGTVITSTSGWDGTIDLPSVSTVSVEPTVASNETASVALAIEVGSDAATLTFDKSVRLALSGQAGKRAGFVPSGSATFTEITATCTADDQTTVDAQLASGGECKMDVGSDLVIWTKHFTTFASYTVATVAQSNPASSRSGGRSGSRTSVSPVVSTTLAATKVPQGRVLGASAYRFSASLGQGAMGDAVMELQNKLKAEGYLNIASTTRYFGPATLAAVKAYQSAKGLPSTGYVGPMTIAKLNEAAASVSDGSVSVKSFVEMLISLGVIGSDKAAQARAAVK